MILGFAHLAVNVADLAEAEAHWQSEGYTRIAHHADVPNPPAKARFGADAPLHDLMLLSGPNLWPLELTRHGPLLAANTQLGWGRYALHVTVPDPAPLRRLLVEGLGFRDAGADTLALESRLAAWSCCLRLRQDETRPVSLAAAGPSCLAFYCSRCNEDARRLLDLGASESTGTFDLTLGERTMTIAMLRAPGGPLLELITPRQRS